MRMFARFFAFLFAAGAIVFVVGALAAGALVYTYSKDLPDHTQLKNYEPPVMTRVHAADGSLVAEYAHERRLYIPANAIPPLVKEAFLSAEDKNFYSHNGIDPEGMLRAVKVLVEGNKRMQGASTITQQVAKNFLLTPRALLRAQDPGGAARAAHRADLQQGADPRALSQQDQSRLRLLRHRRGGAELFRQVGAGTDARRGRLSRGPAQGAQQLQSLAQSRRRRGPPQLRHQPHGRERLCVARRRRGRQGRAAGGHAALSPPTLSPPAISSRRCAAS